MNHSIFIFQFSLPVPVVVVCSVCAAHIVVLVCNFLRFCFFFLYALSTAVPSFINHLIYITRFMCPEMLVLAEILLTIYCEHDNKFRFAIIHLEEQRISGKRIFWVFFAECQLCAQKRHHRCLSAGNNFKAQNVVIYFRKNINASRVVWCRERKRTKALEIITCIVL